MFDELHSRVLLISMNETMLSQVSKALNKVQNIYNTWIENIELCDDNHP